MPNEEEPDYGHCLCLHTVVREKLLPEELESETHLLRNEDGLGLRVTPRSRRTRRLGVEPNEFPAWLRRAQLQPPGAIIRVAELNCGWREEVETLVGACMDFSFKKPMVEVSRSNCFQCVVS